MIEQRVPTFLNSQPSPFFHYLRFRTNRPRLVLKTLLFKFPARHEYEKASEKDGVAARKVGNHCVFSAQRKPRRPYTVVEKIQEGRKKKLVSLEFRSSERKTGRTGPSFRCSTVGRWRLLDRDGGGRSGV